MIKNGQRYLVTTDNWFTAPDGQQYKAVWGTCYVKNITEVFGFTPTRPSTNWYMEVGVEGKEMILAGCQIHYSVRCEDKPVCLKGTFQRTDSIGLDFPENSIYFAD